MSDDTANDDQREPEVADEPTVPSDTADEPTVPSDTADEAVAESPAAGEDSTPADVVEPDEDAEPDLATDVTATDREAAANEAAERARSLQPRTVGLWGVRAAAGVATLAVGVLAVLAAPALPSVEADARILSIAPDAPPQTRVCAGPLLGIGDAGGDASAVAVLAEPTVVDGGDADESLPLDVVDASATVLRGADVAGAQSLSVASDVASGTASSACSEPTTSQWLVGGATTTGRASVLTIANPGTVPTSVDVQIFGVDGQVDAVGTTGIAIAAGSASAIDLAAFAPGLAAPVVHVTSSGGPVVANLQHTVVRTLQPGGVDVVDPTAAGTDVAIPGVVVGDATGIQTQDGFADAVPALRVLAGESTTATITTIADGSEPIASTLDLVGGQVREVDLSGLAPGTYAFTISADVPVVAAARQVRVDGESVDLDWVEGQTAAFDGPTTAAIAPGEDLTLHVLSLADEATTVTVGDQTIELAPGALRSLPIDDGVTTIDGTDVVAAVTASGGQGIAGHAIVPPAAARERIDVVL